LVSCAGCRTFPGGEEGRSSSRTNSRLRTSLRNSAPVAGLAVAAGAILGALAWRIRDWVVMTDELQYTKLATHIGETLSPLPTFRGAHVSAYAQLYPALLAPLYGTLSATDAFRAAHVLNGIVFASAVVPAYLLAREAALSRRWALVVALLSLTVPWNVQTAFLMTESAAYPAFLWAVVAIVRGVAVPSTRRDLISIGGVGLAVLARTQFLSLAVVLVATALIRDPRRHRTLVLASALALVVALIGGSRVLGSYSVTADRWPLPWKAIEQAGAHLDVIGVGVALVPLLLGGAWLVANVRSRDPFALVALVTILVLVLETSSYDASFPGGLVPIRERYVFYLAPLLLVATARALVEGRPSGAALAAATAFVAVTVFAYDFPSVPGLHVDAIGAVSNDWIRDSGGAWFVAAAAVVVALVLWFARGRPRALAIACVLFVLAGTTATAAAAWSRLYGSRSPSSREITAPPQVVLDWVDNGLPEGARAAIVPYADQSFWGPNALLWWDTEFWNSRVQQAYVVGTTWDYAPFPHTQLTVDRATGMIAGTDDAPEYVVASQGDARLRIDGAVRYSNYGLDVIEARRPYRTRWVSAGLDPDGWTRPGRAATIHTFGGTSAAVTLQRADGSATNVCGSGDIALPTDKSGTIPELPLQPVVPGTRDVGVRVTRV